MSKNHEKLIQRVNRDHNIVALARRTCAEFAAIAKLGASERILNHGASDNVLIRAKAMHAEYYCGTQCGKLTQAMLPLVDTPVEAPVKDFQWQ